MAVPNVVSDMTQTAATNSPSGSEVVAPNLDNYLRSLSAFIRQHESVASVAVAAAATVDLTNADGNYVIVTGSAAITSLGVGFVGARRTISFPSAGSVLTNSAALVLPNAANITVAAGDNFTFTCTAASTWQLRGKSRVNTAEVSAAIGYTPANDSAVVHTAGYEVVTGEKAFATVVHVQSPAGTAADGSLRFVPGSGVTPGYVEFYSSGTTRRGYIGYQPKTNKLGIVNDDAWGWDFSGAIKPTVDGNLIWHAGTLPNPMTLDTAQTVTGAKTFTSITATTTVADAIGDVRLIPQNAQNGNYTLVLADKGKHIYKYGNTAFNLTVPTNASVPYAVGTAITVVNAGNTAGNVTVVGAGGVSIYRNGASGSFTVAPGNMVTLLYLGSDIWQA